MNDHRTTKQRSRRAAIATAIDFAVAAAILTIATLASSAPIGYSIAALSMLALATIAALSMLVVELREGIDR